MEKSKDSTLVQLVNKYVSALNDNDLLSKADQLEIVDHLMSESENLILKGLSTNEAFAVAKMRFGDVSILEEEYKKVKPWHGILRAFTYALMVVLIVQSYLLLSQIVKVTYWYFMASESFVYQNVFNTNMIIQVIVGFVFLLILIKSKLATSLNRPSNYWYFPLIYLGVIIAQRTVGFFQYGLRANTISDVKLFGSIFETQSIANLILWFSMSIVVLVYLRKERKVVLSS